VAKSAAGHTTAVKPAAAGTKHKPKVSANQ
jgi:hypothetical protein